MPEEIAAGGSGMQVDTTDKLEYRINALNEDNYVTWKWQIMMVLKNKGLLDSITTKRTTETSRDKQAALIIASALSQQNMQRVINCNTAYEIWTTLEASFENKSSTERAMLLERFHSYKINRVSDISKAIGEIQAKAARLKSLGAAIDDETVISVILRALPESLKTWKSTWMMVNSERPSLNKLVTGILAEVNEMGAPESKAFAVESGGRFGRNKPYHNTGTRQDASPNTPYGSNQPERNKSKRLDTCNYCKKKGHWAKDCRKRIADDRNNVRGVRSQESGRNHKANIALMAMDSPEKGIESTVWIADSGCSIHMTPRLEWIREYCPHDQPKLVTLGDGHHIEDKGSGYIKTTFGTLENVHYVPGLAANLFSISSATNNNSEVQYKKDEIKLTKEGEIILSGHKTHGMYVLDLDIEIDNNKAMAAATLDEWHRRFGHVSKDTVTKMAKSKAVDDLHLINEIKDGICEDCAIGKCKRTSHPEKGGTRATKPGSSLHFDTVGPFRQESLGMSKYLLICKDEATGYRITKAIGSKAEIPFEVKAIISRAEIDTGNSVCQIVTDNGTEFVNNTVGNYLRERGIIHRRSTPYTPQQNGYIEREVRTTIESARTMLIQSGLPKSLWAEAVNTATYVLNRCLSSRHATKTPYEQWFGRKPSVKNLHTFGQRAIVMYRDQERSKWSERGLEQYFVGYTDSYNTFRFYDSEENQVYTSCDAVFLDRNEKPTILEKIVEENTTFGVDEEEWGEQEDSRPSLAQQNSFYWDDEDLYDTNILESNRSRATRTSPQERADVQHRSTTGDGQINEPQEQADMQHRPTNTYGQASTESQPQMQADMQHTPVSRENLPGRRAAEAPSSVRRVSRARQTAEIQLESANAGNNENCDPERSRKVTPKTVMKSRKSSQASGMSGRIKGYITNTQKTLPKTRALYLPPKRIYLSKDRIKGNEESHGASDIHPHHIVEGRDRQARHGEKFYAANVAAIEDESEPRSFTEAMQRRDKSRWQQAMQEELNSLKKNKVWELVPRPKCNVVTNKWVLKIKRDSNGNVDRYKARLVARGFSQVEGLDYNETYAPVASMVSIRMLFAFAASCSLEIAQFDVKTAFLYGDLDETVYMEQPEGFVTDKTKVWLLRRSLYGLKQSPRQWNLKFSRFLQSLNLEMSSNDNCIFYRMSPLLIIAIYVDDGIIFAREQASIDETLEYLKRDFEVHDMNSSTFLGFQFHRGTRGEISLHQTNYIKSILKRFNMSNCKPVETPTTLTKPSLEQIERSMIPASDVPYREAIGSLMYAAVTTRIDIAHAVNVTSRKVENPSQEDWMMVKRIFRYLKGKEHYSLVYKANAKRELAAYCDADFAGDSKTHRSTTGSVYLYGDSPIHWRSKRQALITLSSTEAEIVSLCSTVKEVIWMRKLAIELDLIPEQPTVVFCDNQSAICVATKEQGSQRTRHMSVQANYPKEQVEKGEIEIKHVKSEYQLADALTKPMTTQKFLSSMSILMSRMARVLFSIFTMFSYFGTFVSAGQLVTQRYVLQTTYVNPCYLLKSFDHKTPIDEAIKMPRKGENLCHHTSFDYLDDRDCSELFDKHWQATVKDLGNCRNFSRKKRGVAGVIGIITEVLLTATTNLVKGKVERIQNRNSDSTRDKVYKDVVYGYDHHKEMLMELQHEIRQLGKKNTIQENAIAALKENLSAQMWMLYNVHTKIITMGANLRAIRRMCTTRKLATWELAEIFESDDLRRMDPEDTFLEGVEIDPENYHFTITFTHTEGFTTIQPTAATNNTDPEPFKPTNAGNHSMWIIIVVGNLTFILCVAIVVVRIFCNPELYPETNPNDENSSTTSSNPYREDFRSTPSSVSKRILKDLHKETKSKRREARDDAISLNAQSELRSSLLSICNEQTARSLY